MRANHPFLVHTGHVRVTVPDPSLREVLESDVAMDRTWSTSKRQAQLLLYVLQVAESLAAVVRTGLLSVAVSKPVLSTTIVVTHKQATLTAVARDATGEPVSSPITAAEHVQRLDVLTVAVAGVLAVPSRQEQP